MENSGKIKTLVFEFDIDSNCPKRWNKLIYIYANARSEFGSACGLANVGGDVISGDMIYYSSDIGPVIESPDGNKFRIKVDNNGKIISEKYNI